MSFIPSVLRRLLLLWGLSFLAACSSTAIKPAPVPDIYPELWVGKSWQRFSGINDGYLFFPVIRDNAIYWLERSGYLNKVALDSGKLLWRRSFDMKFSGGLSPAGEGFWALGSHGVLLSLSSEGRELWRKKLSTEAMLLPLATDQVVVTATIDNVISAHSRNSGERLWLSQRPFPSLLLRSEGGIVGNASAFYIPIANGALAAIEPGSGKVLWEKQLLKVDGGNELERLSSFVGLPSLYPNSLCLVGFQGTLMCLEPSSGTVLWEKPFSSRHSLASTKDTIWVADERDIVYAFARSNGNNLWKNEELRDRGLSPPALLDNSVAFGDYKGYIHFFNRETGKLIAQEHTNLTGIANLVAYGNTLIAFTKNGQAFAYTVTARK